MSNQMSLMGPEEPENMPQDSQDVVGLQPGQTDREGAMAKADLYKVANYAHKLFKQIDDDSQMEAWVQAKITKAADYIASVYHYLEYEMKFSEYGQSLENSGMYTENQKHAIKTRLMEAKDKLKMLKKAQADKVKADSKVSEGALTGGHRDCTECGGSGMVYEEPKAIPERIKEKVNKYNRQAKAFSAAAKRMDRNKNGIPDDEEVSEDQDATELKKTGDSKRTATGTLTKTDRGVEHKNTSYSDGSDDEMNPQSGKGKKSHAKAQSAAEKKDRAPKQKQSPKSAKTWGMKDSEKFDNRDKTDLEEEPNEGNVVTGAMADKSVPIGAPIPGTTLKKTKQLETAISGAPQKSGIAATAATTVPGLRATGMDLKKANAGVAMGENQCNHSVKGKSCPVHGMKMCSGMRENISPPDGATAAPPKGKDGQYPMITSGPHKGKRWTAEKPGPTNSAFKEAAEDTAMEKCPPMSHVKKMCQDGKSVAEICKMHPNCDQKQLKRMIADCKQKMDEASMPMTTVNGKKVPAFAADSHGPKDMADKKKTTTVGIKSKGLTAAQKKLPPALQKNIAGKSKDMKEQASSMWRSIKDTQSYMMEKAKAVKDLPGKQEKLDVNHNGKVDSDDLSKLRAGKKETVKESTELSRMKEFLTRLNG